MLLVAWRLYAAESVVIGKPDLSDLPAVLELPGGVGYICVGGISAGAAVMLGQWPNCM